MPGTPQEYVAFAEADSETFYPGDPFLWADGSEVTAAEMRDLFALRGYTIRWRIRKRAPAQRKALALLKTFLGRGQRRSLSKNGYFHVQTQSGQRYRLYPRTGKAERVARHGDRWFAEWNFCLHDDQSTDDAMPPADVSLGHLLWLLADEDGFLAAANITQSQTTLWNGEWMRRCREQRRAGRSLSALPLSELDREEVA